MAHLVLSPKGRYNSSSKSSRSIRPQRLLAYAAGVFALVLLVSWLRSDSSKSSSQQHQQQGRKHYGLAGSTPTAAAAAAAADHQQLERQYQQWLSTFKAADAAYQDYCTAVLHNSTRFKDKGGQANQDIFLFQNLFRHWPMTGRKGFYVEAGANDPLYLSTSLFFDKCLGWDGLCVEPNEKFHKALTEKRSCKLVPECISAKQEVLTLVATQSDATAHVAAVGAGTPIKCAPLSDLLARYAGSAQQRVDVWILDVEGYEMKILNSTNFSGINVDAVMVEDLLMLPKPDVLDILMAQQGYLKYQELALDSVFVRRGHPAAMDPRPLWYPPGFREEVARKQEFVRTNLCTYLKPYWGAAWS